MKQEFKTAFAKRHIMGNGLAAHMDHGGSLFAQRSFHDQADGHYALAERSVFDLPFLLAEFPGRPSVRVGSFETQVRHKFFTMWRLVRYVSFN
ncbi:hypothetical protein ACWNXI_03945 [Caldibacillus thermoamylovorans]